MGRKGKFIRFVFGEESSFSWFILVSEYLHL
jgi:hypothetical protein